jgi:hypothetical protein
MWRRAFSWKVSSTLKTAAVRLRNIGKLVPDYTASHSRKYNSQSYFLLKSFHLSECVLDWNITYTVRLKKSFKTLKAYINLFRGHVHCFEHYNVGRHRRSIRDSYGSMLLPLVLQSVSERVLQRYSICYCVASVAKEFTLKGLQTIHRSRPWTIYSLYTFHCKGLPNTRHTVAFGLPL